MAAPHLPTPLRSLGDYDLYEELGSGGMGVVYRARHRQTHADCAVKLLSAADAELQARFQREGESMARVDDHPHIARVRSLGREGSTSYLVMDLASGGSLARRLTAGPARIEDAVAWARALASALAHAHAKGVLHRDLKPSNVLFEAETPWLVDFGLAKLLDTASLTATGSVLGSPAYMAPEQAAGERDRVGPATDVYGLGAVLYHCLTGRPPFQGSSALDTMRQVLADPPPRPRRLRPEIPPALEAACLRALAKAPADRYGSAADFDAALAKAFAPQAPPHRRRGGAIALGLAGAVALGAWLAAAQTTPAQPPAQPGQSPPGPGPRHRPSPPTEVIPPVEVASWTRLPIDLARADHCPGPHELDVDGAKALLAAGDHDFARTLLLQILSGDPCRSQTTALRELAQSYASIGSDDLVNGERFLLLAILAGDAESCWFLAGLTLPNELRPAIPDVGPRLAEDPRVGVAALWLASHWDPEAAHYAFALKNLPPQSSRPSSEAEALEWVFEGRSRPAEPQFETPTEPHPMWSREPNEAAGRAYDRFLPDRKHLQQLSTDRAWDAWERLEAVLSCPPSNLHGSAYYHAARLRLRLEKESVERIVLDLARAALIGEPRAARWLATEHYPRRLGMSAKHLGLDANTPLALALTRLAADPRGRAPGLIDAMIDELTGDGHALPGANQAYRLVWESFPDAR